MAENKASNWICKNCEHALATAYAFREQAIAAQEKFNELNTKELENEQNGFESSEEPEFEQPFKQSQVKENRKCCLCGFVSQGLRGLSQHIAFNHK